MKKRHVMHGHGLARKRTVGEDQGPKRQRPVPFLTTCAKNAAQRYCQLLSDGKWHDSFEILRGITGEISPEYFFRLRCHFPALIEFLGKRKRFWFDKQTKEMENMGYIERTNPQGYRYVVAPYDIRITTKGRTRFL